MSAWPRVCSCGASYSAEAWRDLPAGGRMLLSDEEGEIDLRHCVGRGCRSTISVLVSDLQEDERLAFEMMRLDRMQRLVAGAERAVDLALGFAAEARASGLHPTDDHRVVSAARQAGEYLRAVVRAQSMRFDCGDLVLVATMNETLQAAE